MPVPLRLSLKALRAFAVTVEHSSITRAAETLRIAPSAVSAALDQVEAEFGATLLIRTRSRGVAATAEGREMALRIRALLEQYDTVLDHGRRAGHALTGTLRIGYYAPVAPAFLPAVLGPLMARAPALAVTLHEHDNESAQAALLEGNLDVILCAGPDLRSGLTARPLLDLPPYVLTAAGHRLAGRAVLSLEDLATERLIMLDRPLARPYVEGLFRQAGFAPVIAAQADSTEMLRALVGAAAGVAILSMRPRTDVTYGGDRLACIPLSPGLPRLTLMLAHATGQPRRAVADFIDALESWMGTQAARALIVEPV